MFRLQPRALRILGPAQFDLFGDSTTTYAPTFPTFSHYRQRRLTDCPPGVLSVASPPWNQILSLTSDAKCSTLGKRQIALVTPHWPSQIWWPLLRGLGQQWLLPGTPWVNPAAPASSQPRWKAVLTCLGAWPESSTCWLNLLKAGATLLD